MVSSARRHAGTECGRILEVLERYGTARAVKLYRVDLERAVRAPRLPCLDHEAMLHGGIPPHMAVYLHLAGTDGLHELVFTPEGQRIDVDSVSTWGEYSPDSHRQVLEMLAREFPQYRVRILGPSWWRGQRRVAEACRAQASLRGVLLGPDLDSLKADVDRLQMVGALMEKQSRVASWGVRTVTGPLLATGGVVTFQLLGWLVPRLGEARVAGLRSLVIGALGIVFLYYGLKAVQLTDMANRIWKRAAEYSLILTERRRLTQLSTGTTAEITPARRPPLETAQPPRH